MRRIVFEGYLHTSCTEGGGETKQVQGRTADQWGQIVRVAIGAARAVRRAVRGDSRAFVLTSFVSRIKKTYVLGTYVSRRRLSCGACLLV